MRALHLFKLIFGCKHICILFLGLLILLRLPDIDAIYYCITPITRWDKLWKYSKAINSLVKGTEIMSSNAPEMDI